MKLRRALFVPMFLFALGSAHPQSPIFASVGANFLSPGDLDYQAIYGKNVFFPDLTLGLRIHGGLYFLGSFGFLAKKGTTPELGLLAQSQQDFLTANLGYIGSITGGVGWLIDGGPALVFYKEEALGIAISGRKPGFNAEFGLVFGGEDSHIFVGLKAGYLYAKDDQYGIKLGGFKAGVCLGFK
jgi:hypothetical protein